MPDRHVDHALEQFTRKHRTGRIARAVDDEQLRPRRDFPFDFLRVRQELSLGRAGIRHEDAMGPCEHEPVVGPGRVGYEHLVARLHKRRNRARDAADTAHGAVDVVDAGLDAVHPV